jgi:pilus assembly protein CpaC
MEKMKRIFAKGFVLLLLVAASLSVSDVARSAGSYSKTVQLIAGKADTVELNGAVADVLVANPSIADVGTLRVNRLYIVGKTVGDTNVLAYDDKGNQLADIIVQVRMDDRNLQDSLREFFPDEKITVRTVKNNIVLSGEVSSPAIANQVRDLASRFLADPKGQPLVDLMKVDGEQQVMLKVRVVEASRAVLREIGIQTNYRTLGETNSQETSTVPNAAGSPSPLGTGSTVGGTMFTNNVGLPATPFGSAAITVGALTAQLNALEQNGIVNTLAEPNLTAISGETAGFLAGGEFPIPTSRDTAGNVTLDFKQFGVSLNFTPTVLNKQRIALHMSAEVSAQDPSAGYSQGGLSIPGLSVRRAETTIELGSGSTLMIAGLIDSSTIHAMNGYPGIENLPVIGELFKSKSFQRNESELLFIVTPYLVNSYAEANAVAEKPVSPKLPGSPGFMQPRAVTVPEKIGSAPVAPVSAMPIQSSIAQNQTVQNPPAQSAQNQNNVSPISQSFINNMRNTYGAKIPENVGTGAGFGYIVE